MASKPSPTPENLLALRERDFRNRTNCFLTEGARFVLAAIKHGWTIHGALTCPELQSEAASHATRLLQKAQVPITEVSQETYEATSTSAEPPGLSIIVEQIWHRLIDQHPQRGDVWVALDEVRHTGNLGTILRTCEAVGAKGVMLIGGELDPYGATAVRATMGALFSQRLIRTSANALRGWKSRNPCLFVGTSLEARTDYRTVSYRQPVVLMMGNERIGLREKQQVLCDRLVTIPMAGETDSLNLAIATGVMLYEIHNQRHPPAKTR